MSDPMEQRYFEDVQLGDEFAELQHPTAEHVRQFLGRSARDERDWNDRGAGRFTDAATARSQGLERPIVPGPMSLAMVTRLVTDWMGPLGHIVELDVSYRRPVLHGDQLRSVALVTDAETSPRVHLDLSLENERGERPLQGTAVVELPTRSGEDVRERVSRPLSRPKTPSD
jgi:acyl dehydratase